MEHVRGQEGAVMCYLVVIATATQTKYKCEMIFVVLPGARGLQVKTTFTFGCGCPLPINGPNGQVMAAGGGPLEPGSCINPCVMTPMDRLRFTGSNGAANPAFNSNNQPDLFPSVETGPAGFLQCGDRNHQWGNCHNKPCAPGTIFSFGAQVCTTDDVGQNTPGVVPQGNAFMGNTFPGAPLGSAFFPGAGGPPPIGGSPIPFKKK